MFSFFKNQQKISNFSVDPDSVFLDSYNMPKFDKSQLEGKIETPISNLYISILILSFVVLFFVFFYKAFSVQVLDYDKFSALAKSNRFDKSIIFAKRGNIYDRDKKLLVWNAPIETIEGSLYDTYAKREYIQKPGFAHLLGYVSYPAKDKSGNWWRTEYIGKAGVEESFNDYLSGINGAKIIEVDVTGKPMVENIVEKTIPGKDLTLTIDANIQENLFKVIKKTVDDLGYRGGASAIMNVENGEIIALVSYPEFDSVILSEGKNKQKIQEFFNDKRAVFLNRVISAVYPPGSTIKPYMTIAALEEKVINPHKNILSTGELVIPNPFNPDRPSIFKDWKAHGYVDARKAIAVSSNVYFYAVGGGLPVSAGLGVQKGIGIRNIIKYAKIFGFGQKTGIKLNPEAEGNIPSPEWKQKVFGQKWLLGDTYNSSIGQFGWLVTPIQILRYTAAVANGGYLLSPRISFNEPVQKTKLNLDEDNIKIAQEGMKMAVTDGTLKAINFKELDLAGKTGTAQVGKNNSHKHSWVIAFWPYKKPKYAIVIVLERAPKNAKHGAIIAARMFFDWLKDYYKSKKPHAN